MRPLYHELNSQLEIFIKKNAALPPHLHKYLECIYVTEGNLRLRAGTEWMDLYPRDMAVIFPDVIHQISVDEQEVSQSVYVLGATVLAGSFAGILQKYEPRVPVIRKEMVHPDIFYGLSTLLQSKQEPYYAELQQAYFQIFLARILPACQLEKKAEIESSDLAWQIISYISQHFMDDISLTSMAHQLCASPYALSRVFSGTLHMNFNQYLNEMRLEYASHLLRTTDRAITDIFIDSGFSSQATFNRVFKEKYQISPRDYRRQGQSTEGRQLLPAVNRPKEEKKTETKKDESTPWQLATGRFL